MSFALGCLFRGRSYDCGYRIFSVTCLELAQHCTLVMTVAVVSCQDIAKNGYFDDAFRLI